MGGAYQNLYIISIYDKKSSLYSDLIKTFVRLNHHLKNNNNSCVTLFSIAGIITSVQRSHKFIFRNFYFQTKRFT